MVSLVPGVSASSNLRRATGYSRCCGSESLAIVLLKSDGVMEGSLSNVVAGGTAVAAFVIGCTYRSVCGGVSGKAAVGER